MYASRAVCSRCATRLLPVPGQRLGNAWFASLADAAELPDQQQQQANVDLRHHVRKRRSPFRSSRGMPSPSGEDPAVALFQDVVKPATHGQAAPAASAADAASSLAEWEIASKVKDMMGKGSDVKVEMQRFKDDVWPHVHKLRGRIPKHLYITVTQCLGRACDGIVENGLTGLSMEISNMYASIGIWDLELRNRLVLNLCHVLVTDKRSSSERGAIVNELIDMWKHISQLKRKSRQWEHLQFALASPEEVGRDIDKSRRGAGQRPSSPADLATRALAAIFLQYLPEQARQLVPGLLATVAVVSDPRFTRQGAQTRMAPLLNVVAVALQRADISTSWLGDVFSGSIKLPLSKMLQLKAYVVAQWPQTGPLLTDALTPEHQSSVISPAHGHRGSFKSKAGGHTSSKNPSWSNFHKQLRVAYRSRNTTAIVATWQNLKACVEQQPTVRKQLAHEAELLDFCIFIWCAVRRPAMLQETLNLMGQLEVRPTVKTYTAMMHGWKICKDVGRIEALWQSLAGSGMHLDDAIWTERISALIELGKPEAGLQALAEMQAAWKKASAAKDSPRVVPPTVKAVNAAFKGLIRLDPKAAHEVLAWAAREGIEPDVRTHNILLQEHFRSGAPGGASGILKAMKERGIEPDGATFTIILEEVLGTMAEAPAAEQVQAVRQILEDIEAASIKANLETYGKMLHAVASLPSGGADDAVQAILTHMRARGLAVLSPHMITILVERVVQRDPPDLADAVRAILRDNGLAGDVASGGDQTLWERVMSAYAVGGDLEGALGVFDALASSGRPVTSLPCLRDLVSALLGGGLVDDAKRVVGEVVRSQVASQGHVGERYWRHHFWYLAKANGLLSWEEAPRELRGIMMEES